jgi:hypothetical protein
MKWEDLWHPAAAGVIWNMAFSGDNAAEEQNHAGGGGKQRKVGKKRQTWVLRNGGFQFGG